MYCPDCGREMDESEQTIFRGLTNEERKGKGTDYAETSKVEALVTVYQCEDCGNTWVRNDGEKTIEIVARRETRPDQAPGNDVAMIEGLPGHILRKLDVESDAFLEVDDN